MSFFLAASAGIDPWVLTFSFLMVAVTIWMGFRSAKTSKTASDFFVAGRSVSVGWNASAISGEYLSAASFMGVAGMVMSSGYDALWYPVCYACGYLFLLLFIAGPLRRFGAYTIPDFAEGRYDSPLFRKIAVIFVLFIGFFYTMPQMKGAGTALAFIFPGMPYWGGVVLVGAVITFNVALGGMKGITLVQAFQYWAKMFAISVPVFVLMAVYGDYGDHLNVNDGRATAPVATNTVAVSTSMTLPVENGYVTLGNPRNVIVRFEDKVKELAGNPTVYRGTSNAKMVSVLSEYAGLKNIRLYAHTNLNLVRMLGQFNVTFTNQQETLSTYETFLKSNGVALLSDTKGRFLAVPESDATNPPPVPDSINRQPLPAKAPADTTWINPFGPLTTKAAKASKLSEEETKPLSLLYTYSLILALVCGTAGLPHILVRFYTNPDGVAAKRTTMWVMILIGVFYVFPPVFGVLGRNLLPELYNGTGVKGTDGIVLKLPLILKEKYGVLGQILSGITCAGAFAAFMSTFSGLLVSMTGALAHDVYGRILRPESTAADRMKMFKVCAIICGGGSVLLGLLVENFEINKMVGWAFAIAAASYFPLLFMSTWWRGMTMKGAATGMLVGGVCSLFTVVTTMLADNAVLAMTKNPEAVPKTKFLVDFYVDHPLLRILAEQPAIWAVPLSILLMIVVSKLTSREVPQDIRMKMLVLHAPEKLGLKQEYIQEHQGMGH